LAFRDIIVVNVPEPAINGKAMGTTVAALTSFSLLKNSAPNTISRPKIKITIEPPTAKEPTSKLNKFKKGSPIKRKRTIKAPEINVALTSLIPPNLFFNEIRMGIEPIISIIANKVKVTVRRSFIFRFIAILFIKLNAADYLRQ
jgi:hypothetical protein